MRSSDDKRGHNARIVRAPTKRDGKFTALRALAGMFDDTRSRVPRRRMACRTAARIARAEPVSNTSAGVYAGRRHADALGFAP